MNPETIQKLNAINRRFYDDRADEFDQTRERSWLGWTELFDRYGSRIARSPRVLDIGCGNGRFARFLHQHHDERFFYCGVDASGLGLEHARRRLGELSNVQLFEHDFVVEPEPLPPALASARFDLVVVFGVLHHVPGRARRKELLTALARSLAPAGVLAYTVWRFDRFERFTRKLVPWEELLENAPGIDSGELEPGDYVMTWGATEPSYRYCHAMSDDEANAIEAALPLTALPSFLGDGDLNRYHVLVKETPLDRRQTTQREGRAGLE